MVLNQTTTNTNFSQLFSSPFFILLIITPTKWDYKHYFLLTFLFLIFHPPYNHSNQMSPKGFIHEYNGVACVQWKLSLDTLDFLTRVHSWTRVRILMCSMIIFIRYKPFLEYKCFVPHYTSLITTCNVFFFNIKIRVMLMSALRTLINNQF